MLTALRGCCRIYTELPSAATSIVGGDGTRFFRRAGIANAITICPRLRDGTHAAYIYPNDVQLTVHDSSQKPIHAQVQLDIDSSSNIALLYTLDDVHGQLKSITELYVHVRVCGVLLVDVCVRVAAFDGRTAGRLRRQPNLPRSETQYIAIHPAGMHLVASTPSARLLNVFGLPDMNLLAVISDGLGDFSSFPRGLRGLCFTDAGTLLAADNIRNRVRHWTLKGLSIASYAIRYPTCVASRGNIFAVGTETGVRVCLLEGGNVLHAWLDKKTVVISSIGFVDADTLAVSNYSQKTINLHALNGEFLKQIADDISSYGTAMCTNGYLLVSDFCRSRIRVFAPNDAELTTAPLAAHAFRLQPISIALHGEHAYVTECLCEYPSSSLISVFE